CVVALDALTARMKWYQQQVHQPQGDDDTAAAPVNIDVVRNGQVIPAIAEYTKLSLLFIYNRVTGEPIFGVEERSVPARAGRRGAAADGTVAPGGRAEGVEAGGIPRPFRVNPLPLAPTSGPHGTPPLNPVTITPELQAFCDGLKDT